LGVENDLDNKGYNWAPSRWTGSATCYYSQDINALLIDYTKANIKQIFTFAAAQRRVNGIGCL